MMASSIIYAKIAIESSKEMVKPPKETTQKQCLVGYC